MDWQSLATAVACLNAGGIVAYPTEAVYGLGCNPANEPGLKRLLEIKQRPMDKGFILIASDFSQLAPYCDEIEAGQWERVQKTWPGPCTWLFPARQASTLLNGGKDTIAVRVTANNTAAALCAACDYPLVSTSANFSGQKPASNASEVARLFGEEIDYILDGETDKLARPTPILDARDQSVIRA